jgi:RluA family pseudouridine synthase
MTSSAITNISTYKFAPLGDLKALRRDLLDLCRRLRLGGTILLAREGINVFVAGPRVAVDELVDRLRAIPSLADIAPKYSESTHQPFRRMLVKIKREIIAFGVPEIDPAQRTSPRLPPRTLAQWLAEGKPVTLLDTRNDYEVRLGTFRGARPIGIDHFRDFPAAAARLPESLKDETIVTFCTGGIRCEKAGPYLESIGFKHVFQLDGGILKYFEETGGAHYDGECFVFDQRVGVDPALRETSSAVCFNCQTPLTVEEQQHPDYRPPHACPHCHRTPEEERAALIAKRHEAIRRATTPLPGSEPYENRRPLLAPPEAAGRTVLEMLTTLLPHHPAEEWTRACAEGRLVDRDDRPCAADDLVRPGDWYVHLQPATTEPDVDPSIRVLHEDEAILVLHKPAPLPMHPGGRYNRNTLEHILRTAFAPLQPRPAHRLDAATTGVVVCARTRKIAGRLQPQFARGEVEKTYLVRVHGHPLHDTFACDAPIASAAGDAGSRAIDAENGLTARTDFEVLRRNADGTTLLAAYPKTGRTNQIRLHLRHLGLPVCGDPGYLADGRTGPVLTPAVGDPPMCLHAWRIAFAHPLTAARVEFESPAPAWAQRRS